MTLAAGKLNRRVTIQRRVTGEDAAGQPVETHEDVGSVWADVRHLSGLETLKADAPVSTVKASIRIRRRTDIDAGMRVRAEGRDYAINAVLHDADRQFTDLVAEISQ